MRNILLIFSIFLLLTGCTKNEETQLEESTPPLGNIDDEEPTEHRENEEENENTDVSTETDFKRYFKPADSTASFNGDGNEFASFTETTKLLAPNYIAAIIDNGGAVVMKVYRILEDEIDLVMDEVVEGLPEDAVYPDVAALEELPSLETYLAGPIEAGTTFETWTITETNLTLVTPYKTFQNVFVIEESGDNFINKKYFAEDYGVIKTESVSSVELNEEFTVTSTLQDIHK